MRILKIAGGLLLALIALLALVLALLSVFDWNRARPWIESRVSEGTGRAFAINGDLSLAWVRPGGEAAGWRKWVPWPHLRARDVGLGNPDWASTGREMARAQQIDVTVNPLALLQHHIMLSSLILTEPNLVLEQDAADNRNNWTFKKSDTPSGWTVALEDLHILRGNVRFVDVKKKADAMVRLDTVNDGNVKWEVAGRFNGEPISGGGTSGGLLGLQQKNARYPVDALLKVGRTTIEVKGALTDPVHLSALDVNLKILGASMADLFAFSGVLLPDTPKFSTEGHLVGNLKTGSINLRYDHFKGRVGASDIGGTLEFVQHSPRSLLRGDVESKLLNLKDLGALLGSDSADEKRKRGDTTVQPDDKALPVEKFKSDRWSKMDVDVHFAGRQIIRTSGLPIENLSTRIKMDNALLTLSPLDFGVAHGTLHMDLTVNGRQDPAEGTLKLTARGLEISKLFPTVKRMQASLGQLNGAADLRSTGNSPSALLGSANGELKALVSQGTVSKFILEAIGLNVGSVVLTELFGDRPVKLNCMATDFNIKNGLMTAKSFIVDTEDASIAVDGTIDLAKERLHLGIHPHSKGIRLISLRSPLHIDGSFKHPDVGVDKGMVALKGGGAIALGVLAAPAAALLALINPGQVEAAPCVALLQEARKPIKQPIKPAGKPAVNAPAKAAQGGKQ
jgi:uncharacterized protein involved in outer membrane biogenesis